MSIPEANRLLQQLAALDLGQNQGVLGDFVQESAYGADGPFDSGQVFQAALVMPHGIGVVLWDTEELHGLRDQPDLELREALLRFSCFEDCSIALQALLQPHAAQFIQRFLDSTGLSRVRQMLDDEAAGG